MIQHRHYHSIHYRRRHPVLPSTDISFIMHVLLIFCSSFGNNKIHLFLGPLREEETGGNLPQAPNQLGLPIWDLA